jgi:septal ring factor EnvC (AmiA/AmiB activator)
MSIDWMIGMIIVLEVGLIGWFYKYCLNALNDIKRREQLMKEERGRMEAAQENDQRRYEICLSDIAKKRAELERQRQSNLNMLTEAQKTKEVSNEKIAQLEKQIQKLQSELHHARQRAKRLATQINPVV